MLNLYGFIFVALTLNTHLVLSLSDVDTDLAENQIPVDEGDARERERDSSQNVTQSSRSTVSTNPNDIDFYLYYDKNNPEFADMLILGDTRSVKTAHFVIGKPVIFVTHGFMSGYDMPDSLVPLVKNAYLAMGFVNIIATDWRRLATAEGPLALLSYYTVMENGVPIVGNRVCKMILFLIKTKIITGPQDVHLVGHSLGAHVSGIAGYCIKKKLGKLVDRITGLDPAGPLYQFVKASCRLDAAHGAFVDVLHTDIGMLGSDMKLGTVDFYSNGGSGLSQRNCANFSLSPGPLFTQAIIPALTGSCAHQRAYQLFARSILRTPPELYGCRCVATMSWVLPSTCASPMNICNDKTLYGEYVPRTAEGTFYINVDKDLPGVGVEALQSVSSASG